MDICIYSTMSTGVEYTVYKEGGGDLPVVAGVVLVKGGANVADRHFITPKGVETRVSAEQLALLEANPVFKSHVKSGYLKIDYGSQAVDKAVSDLEARDMSAPLTADDYAPGKEPKTSKKK